MPKQVDVLGLRVELPDEQADALIKARDAEKAESRKVAERLAALEQQAKAAEDKARSEAEAAQRKAALDRGEFDKVLAAEKEAAEKRLASLQARTRDHALAQAIARHKAVLPEAVADIAAQLRAGCMYDPDADALTFVDAAGKPHLGSDGKPLAADAAVDRYLADRPWFRKPSNAPGSGAAPGAGPSSVPTITQEQYAAATRDPAQAQAQAKLLAAGKLRVV